MQNCRSCRWLSSFRNAEKSSTRIIPDLQEVPPSRVRNFGIIAHIDHGKSTLADRLLELTGCLGERADRGPSLDCLPVEKERGITVKAQTATMFYKDCHTNMPSHHYYMLNLIDTPGHADFAHQVTRSLAAMQGALLVVDATAGVQAQTIAHYWRAREHGLQCILPVINKIDLAQANVDAVVEQLERQLEIDVAHTPILAVSARTGHQVSSILQSIINHIPPPQGLIEGSFEAVLIDCWFHDFRGVICLLAIRHGKIEPGAKIKSVCSGKVFQVEQIGIRQPDLVQTDYLHAGQVGYVICGMRSTKDAIIGDTFLDPTSPIAPPPPLSNRPLAKPTVFVGIFPAIRDEYERVQESINKLLLNDTSVTLEKANSAVLGPGWKLGFFGSLHMDVFRQRLEQEFGVVVIMTAPSVPYEVLYKNDPIAHLINSPEQFPLDADLAKVQQFREQMVCVSLILRTDDLGGILELLTERRGGAPSITYISTDRVKVQAELPLLELMDSFNDRLMSLTQGYASFDYEVVGWRTVDLVRVVMHLNGEAVDCLSILLPRDKASAVSRQWCKRLASQIPPQQFAIAIQARIGTKILARENISALRKDVTAKCYGGDKSRKTKLLEAQKEGKARMRTLGKVEIPQEAFITIMRLPQEN